VELSRLIYMIAARGESIIVGRGAGILLHTDTTLNVRIVAPLSERVAYLSQWLRLAEHEAAAEVESRDAARRRLHKELTDREATDLTQYDIVLNSGRLGVPLSAQLIIQAVRSKKVAEEMAHSPVSDPDLYL
jgi:cytidylate kinase